MARASEDEDDRDNEANRGRGHPRTTISKIVTTRTVEFGQNKTNIKTNRKPGIKLSQFTIEIGKITGDRHLIF